MGSFTGNAVVQIADGWRGERAERLGRTHLEHDDFTALREAGYLDLVVPTDQGGEWRSAPESFRTVADTLRTLAAGDPSPTLVASMHPAVLAFWLGPDHADPTWDDQRRAVTATAADGAQWGTVTSEPGSGGDIARTRSKAALVDDGDDIPIPGRRYLVSGDKHFGSGTGVCHYMLTSAIPDGEDDPALFFLDTRALVAGEPLAGHTIVGEWDGVGMRATQSHAVRLEGCRAVRVEWPGEMTELVAAAGPLNMTIFTAVVLGVVDEAIATAREKLRPRADELRAYEQVEWSRATTDHWVAAQAYEGMLRAVEAGDPEAALAACLRGKTAIAELAEGALDRMVRVVGGGTFSMRSPFASWYEDVRALGFLRPPWGLAADGLHATAW